MNGLLIAAKIEWLKIKKARIFMISVAAVCLLPCVCALFLAILQNPNSAAGGILAQKAQIAGAADWISYFGLLNEMMSVGGILIFGFIAAWAFGREYSDRTAKDLFAMPVTRYIIVLAKYIALTVWSLLLTIIALVVAVALGLLINPPEFSFAALLRGSGIFIISALLTLPLITPVSFFASFGKGYLSPLGFIIFTILFAQVAEIVGIGGYCPWNMSAVFAGVAKDSVTAAGYLLYVFLILLGLAATLAWWRFADQKN